MGSLSDLQVLRDSLLLCYALWCDDEWVVVVELWLSFASAKRSMRNNFGLTVTRIAQVFLSQAEFVFRRLIRQVILSVCQGEERALRFLLVRFDEVLSCGVGVSR